MTVQVTGRSFGRGARGAASASIRAAGRSRAAAACTGAAGASSTSRGRAALDDAPAVHDDRLVGDLAHDREVVADEDVGDAGPLADVGEQVEDLRLDRDVERGDRLVEDRSRAARPRARARSRRAGAGRRDSARGQRAELALVEADQVAELGDARRARSASTRRSCRRSTSSMRLLGALARVEARVRVLEDDLDLAAARGGARCADRAGVERSRPQAVIVPAVGAVRPTSILAIVVLPEPGLADDRQRAAVRHREGRRRRPRRRSPYSLRSRRLEDGLRHGAPTSGRPLGQRRAARAARMQRTRPPSSASTGGRAARHASWAKAQRGANAQPSGRLERATRAPRDRRQAVRACAVDRRARAGQRRGVRVQRAVVQARGSRGLDDLPGVHDRRAVAHRRRELEVVGDEQQRHAALAAQLVEDRHDLGLGRHVERGRRLVGEQQARLGRAARRRSSPAAAGRRTARAGTARRRRSPSGIPTSAQQPRSPGAAPRAAHAPQRPQRLGHEVADPCAPG